MSIVEKAVDKLKESKSGRPGHAPGHEPPEFRTTTTEDARPGPAAEPLRLDLNRLRASGALAPPSMETQVKDEYRRIKRPLLANVSGRGAVAVENGNRIMITSALAGEGKTFTSFNLALSLAQERDISVLLVDGDVARPTTSRILGIQDRRGLLDLLTDERLRPDDLVIPTDIPGLSVLPAGQRHSLSTELLSSERMDSVVDALAQQRSRRIVLFDSPPLLVTSESVALSGPMGQVVVVVKAGQTLRQQVQGAIGLLDPTKAINLVLNQTRQYQGQDYYGGYGYGYE